MPVSPLAKSAARAFLDFWRVLLISHFHLRACHHACRGNRGLEAVTIDRLRRLMAASSSLQAYALAHLAERGGRTFQEDLWGTILRLVNSVESPDYFWFGQPGAEAVAARLLKCGFIRAEPVPHRIACLSYANYQLTGQGRAFLDEIAASFRRQHQRRAFRQRLYRALTPWRPDATA